MMTSMHSYLKNAIWHDKQTAGSWAVAKSMELQSISQIDRSGHSIHSEYGLFYLHGLHGLAPAKMCTPSAILHSIVPIKAMLQFEDRGLPRVFPRPHFGSF